MMDASKDTLHIAYFQQDIVWEDAEANHRMVESAFERALALSHADLLVVPETFSTGFSDHMALLAEPEDGPSLSFARRMAQKHDALFVATWAVRQADGQVFNRLHLVRPDGSHDHYDKAHTFRMSSEASQLSRGHHRLIVPWRGWNIRPAVCYDLRFPSWLRNGLTPEGRLLHDTLGTDATPSDSLGNPLQYDLLLVCANWPASRHRAWSTLLQARAIENLAYVVGVNRVGTDGLGIPYSGHSAVYDFRGQPLSEARPSLPEVRLVSLSLSALQTFRNHWPFYLDFDI